MSLELRLWTVVDIMRAGNVPRQTIIEAANRGSLKCIRTVGDVKFRLFQEHDVKDFLAKREKRLATKSQVA
jgi:hypothetical protein